MVFEYVPNHPGHNRCANKNDNNDADNFSLFVNQSTDKDMYGVSQDEKRSASADAIDNYFTHERIMRADCAAGNSYSRGDAEILNLLTLDLQLHYFLGI